MLSLAMSPIKRIKNGEICMTEFLQDWLALYQEPMFWKFPVATLALSVGAFLVFALPWTVLAWFDPQWAQPYKIQQKPFYDGPVYHDFHHARFKGNYAGALHYVDGFFGTYIKEYLDYKKQHRYPSASKAKKP